MKTIAIIDDDIHIGDMLTEVLTREGYAILKLLLENPEQVIAKSVLLDRISIDTPDCTERSLKQHISNLRKKMQDVNGTDYIETIWGIGFKVCFPSMQSCRRRAFNRK